MAGEWTLEPFEADDGTVPFGRFIDGLSDFKFVALDTAIDRVLSVRGIDLARTEWLKALGEGLHEFRVRHDADEVARMFGGDAPDMDGEPEKVLLRVFVHFHGQKIVLLLGGLRQGQRSQAASPTARDRRGTPAARPVQGAAASRPSQQGSERRLTNHGVLPILMARRCRCDSELSRRNGRSPRASLSVWRFSP